MLLSERNWLKLAITEVSSEYLSSFASSPASFGVGQARHVLNLTSQLIVVADRNDRKRKAMKRCVPLLVLANDW